MHKLQLILFWMHTNIEQWSLYKKAKLNYQNIENFINQNIFMNVARIMEIYQTDDSLLQIKEETSLIILNLC